MAVTWTNVVEPSDHHHGINHVTGCVSSARVPVSQRLLVAPKVVCAHGRAAPSAVGLAPCVAAAVQPAHPGCARPASGRLGARRLPAAPRPKQPTTATGPAEMAFGERRSSRARREAISFAVARRSRRVRRCAPSPATCWSLARLSNVGAVCARRAWGVGRARGHGSLCRLVIMFVITTGPVGPVRRQRPLRPAAVTSSEAKPPC